MQRREFIGGFVVFVLAPAAVAACGGGGDEYGGGSCDGAGATTSTVSGHNHFVCVPNADLDAPPATANG